MYECILPSALTGVSYSTPSRSEMQLLKKDVAKCIWGTAYSTRSPDVLLTVCLRGHTHDPYTAMLAKILNTFLEMCQRRPDLRAKCVRLSRRYDQQSLSRPLGPVGVVRFAASEAGASFANGFGQIRQAIGNHIFETTLHPNTSKQTRNHLIRDVLRRKRWSDMAAARPSLSGIENGVDWATNALWLSWSSSCPLAATQLRRAICGGIQ